MLPDFDNAQKWLKWLKEKRIVKIWMISPIVLAVIIFALWTKNASLKNDLKKTRNELIPVRELYPKLELSAAVAKLIEDHNVLKQAVNLAKQKEIQKQFIPLSRKRITTFQEVARSLTHRYPDIEFEIQVLCVNPSTEQFKKATELVNLFEGTNIKAKYANTMFSSKHNVVLKYPADLPEDVVNRVTQLLRTVFRDAPFFKPLKPSGKDSLGTILIYFLGTPLFDDEECVFYSKAIF